MINLNDFPCGIRSGLYLECDGKIEKVYRGYKTNLYDDESDDINNESESEGYLLQAINGKALDSYSRALITYDRLGKLGFKRDMPSPRYTYKCITIEFSFSSGEHVFYYITKAKKHIVCKYLDEIQLNYEKEYNVLPVFEE